MDSTDYRQECLRLLSDTTYYAPLTQDPTKSLLSQIKIMVEEAKGNAWVTFREAEFLVTTHLRTPYFYCLPKIHKGILPPPGRPIVSGTGSLLEPLSTFCDSFLQPLVKKSSTYLKDTKDVLNLIEVINSTTSVEALIILDFESLYTNIPQAATLQVVEAALLQHPWTSPTPVHFVMHCASLAMTQNYFQFEETLYHQIRGTSMGSTFAPSLACLYMYQFEKLFILPTENPFFENIKLWRRYINDILIIWQGSLQTIDSFTNWINTLDPFLRFTAHVSTTQVPFLDLMIQIVNGKLVTDTYHKSTDRNSLLLYESHHPKAPRDNLPFGQFLRLRRNCSTAQLFEAQACELEDKLRHRHYPTKIINPAYKRARHNHREALLAPIMREEQVRLTCVSTYTPMSNTV
ncbi:hypothetical protein NDU88_006201 [Pleurodeles waltl]|uniref:Helix-turn-helix domain-containing protein n=1 Tax=Pleurodeles waltl TaxID=8319 RepID=A0AAV7ULF7_PLEWA|nr:hypothetical protein NDU88_006201 [Pleurodeles waltl]